jgi:hypothetical protein
MSCRARFGLTLTACIFVHGSLLTSQGLDHRTYSGSMEVIMRDQTCTYGKISGATASTITVTLNQTSPTTLQKSTVLQIREGGSYALVYSARSSWLDVKKTVLDPQEYLLVVTKSGRSFKIKSPSVDETSITAEKTQSNTALAKKDIATVDYVRLMPTSDEMQALGEEAPYLLLFDPQIWWRASGLSSKIRVRVYDAAMPEDDSELKCNKN